MRMEKRFEYMILTLVGFGVGFVLYGMLGLIGIGASDLPLFGIANRWAGALVVALSGGYFFFCLLSGLLLIIGWLSQKTLEQKIFWTVLFPIPVWLGMAAIIYSVPYGIYNAVQYKKISNSRQ